MCIAPGNHLVYRSHDHQTEFWGGDPVKVDFQDGQFVLNDSLVHFPAPTRPTPVSKLAERYGAIPFVRHALAGNSDEKAWRSAVAAYQSARDSLYHTAVATFDSIRATRSTAAAVQAAITLLGNRSDIFEHVRLLPPEDPRSGPTVLGVKRAGTPERSFELEDRLGLRRASARHGPSLDQACEWLEILSPLEEALRRTPVEIELAFGEIRMETTDSWLSPTD